MKILHTGDIHLGELIGPAIDGNNARMIDTIACMDHLVKKAMEENVDIILIAGDMFHKSKLWADEMLNEIQIAADWLKCLSSIAPTVLMFGTANHDNVMAFQNIRGMQIPNLNVVLEPDLLTLSTKCGEIQIAAVPGVDKGYFRANFPGMDMEDENKAISEALGNVILGLGTDADPSIPLVLMSHYTVTGCQLENGETVFLNSDIVIPAEILSISNYDLVCLGHIHKAQSVPYFLKPVYYCGPLNAITFNEEGQNKGFWVHTITNIDKNNIQYSYSQFIETPSRQFITLEMNENEIESFVSTGNMFIGPEVSEKIVRVLYSCSNEINKQFNKKSLEKLIYENGAFYVHEIKAKKITVKVDKNLMSENDSVESNLISWINKQGITDETRLRILELAAPMINKVSASLPSGKLTGIFEPLRLVVKNYRSYLEEEFDFTKVNFATVNGPNGIGKSSFFMDAISDCLYEEPREGELTGWINNSDDVKSGAITFEFVMGSDRWRVIRTRSKSGKTTLALQKWIDNKWEDCSGDKKDHTQEKIISLLGMDALTFKSCALIMQDNYGVFLEAEKTERMQVLGNILGLGIYDKLYDLSKEELKIQNRKVELLKSEISTLDEKIKTKDTYESQLNESLEERSIIQSKIKSEETKLEYIKLQVTKLKDIQIQINSVTEQMMTITKDIDGKNLEVINLNDGISKAENIITQEDKILSKIKEYEVTKDKITELKVKVPLQQQKQNEMNSVMVDIKKTVSEIEKNAKLITQTNDMLTNKPNLEMELTDLEPSEYLLYEADKTEVELRELKQQKERYYQQSLLAEKEFKNTEEKLNTALNMYLKKAELLKNSKCPLDNPSCNFLKDAVESVSKIQEIKNQLANMDKSEITELERKFYEINKEIESIIYIPEKHQSLRKRVSELNKYKEELIEISGKEDLLTIYIDKKHDLSLQLEKLMTKKQSLENEINDLRAELIVLPEFEKAMPSLEKWYTGKDELPAAKARLTQLKDRLQVLNNELASKQSEYSWLDTVRDKLLEEKNLISANENDISVSERTIKNLYNELTNIDISIGISRSKLEELDKDGNSRVIKADELKLQADLSNCLALLVKAFCIDGIPFQIVRSVVTELSVQSNDILSQMTGGKMSIEMKTEKVLKNKNEVNALEIWINDYQRGNMPYLSRSGGQKVKAALSVAFALADLKANRAGIQLGMMFIDEPPFLDKDGVQAYCDALELMHNRYPSMRVVAISHDPAMKARFPQEIEVMDAGDAGSKIIFQG